MRTEKCPGCLTTQPVGHDGRFVAHGADPARRSYCSWAGRQAVDFKHRVNLAALELKRLYPDGAPKAPRKRRPRRGRPATTESTTT